MGSSVLQHPLPLLIFVLSHLLLLLLLLLLLTSFSSIKAQPEQAAPPSCPYTISFLCGVHTYPPLLYPFTNSSFKECGYFVLDCIHDQPIVSVKNKRPRYLVKWFEDANQTVDLAPFQMNIDPNAKPPDDLCYAMEKFSLFESPSISFAILHNKTYVGCPDDFGMMVHDIDGERHVCGYIYGPYSKDSIPHQLLGIPECSIFPAPPTGGLTFQYNFTSSCQECVHNRRGRCYDDPHSSWTSMCTNNTKHTHKWIIILAAVIPGAVILAAIALIIFWRRRKIKQASFKNMERNLDYTETDLEMNSTIYGVPVFSYEELKVATNNFDGKKELGEGGFGIVYHGKLNDGREVAVKRLYEKNYKRIEQFINEIKILTTLRHQNLVTLYGCTSRHSRELLLVYEFIPNGTVADHLHGHEATSKSLTWPIRMSIAIETASALAYLHAKEVIHRDVKTNNILLDNNFTVKVADFGLSRLFPSDMSHVSTAPQGTPGYVDPEYHQCYHLTDKSDVYSFGVVLVELISSLPAVDVDRHRHEINLSNFAMNRIQSSAFNDLVDPSLGFDSDFKVRRMTTLVAELAFRCLQHERDVRPSMKEVLDILERIQKADYGALEAAETRKNKAGAGEVTASSGSTNPPPPSPAESDDVGLLRNAHQQPPPSPNSVMDNWTSKNTTPNTSNSGLT